MASRSRWRKPVSFRARLIVLIVFVGSVILAGTAPEVLWLALALLVLALPVRYIIRRHSNHKRKRTNKPPLAGSHDIAYAAGMDSMLPERGWRVGMPIAIGRSLGMDGGRAWFPHALILGATGSGKTTLLRPFLQRWSATGPAAVMSTKGDILPAASANDAGRTIQLVTPKGRRYLDMDGQERLAALEAAGWRVIDCCWEPVSWAASASDEAEGQFRAETLARCLAGVVAQGEGGSNFWSAASGDFLTAAILIEAAAIRTASKSWSELLGGRRNPTTGADGIERLVSETQLERLAILASIEALPDTLSPTERAAASEVQELGRLLKANNVTALSKYQTATTALGAYRYPAMPRPPINIGAWAHSSNDLLAVIIPSAQSVNWSAPMAALALALWTEASTVDSAEHLIILDEMASLAPVPTIHEWTAQGRSLGVHVVAVLQHEQQAQKWSPTDTSGWILHNWPLVLVASGTPAIGLARLLAAGEGRWEVEKTSSGKSTAGWSTTTSVEMRDRIEASLVFDTGYLGVWRVIDRRIGPWAVAL